MELSDYRKELIEDVKATALSNEEGTTSSFVQVVADKLIEVEVLPDFYPSFYVGATKKGKKMRVDGYVLDEFDWTLYITIAEYSGSDEAETLIRSEAIKLFERTYTFIKEVFNGTLKSEIEISTSAYDLMDLLSLHKANIRKYKFVLMTDKIISDRFEVLPTSEIDNCTVEYHIWDVRRLYRVLSSEQGVETNEIIFSDFTNKGIPCIEASKTSGQDYRSFLCVLPANALADIYDKYGSKLLEGNVRSFLSTKVSVNKKIRQTIMTEPKMFFAYNNGISATATDVHVENGPDGKYITFAKDFQVVNGGQTTASLSSARHKDKANLDDIFVQMKLTMVDESQAPVVIPNISRSSNSQNKVSEADFFSNHQFHVRMEQISRRLFAPAVGGSQHETHWFYERARGQYLQSQMKMTKSAKTKFEIQNPKKQVITKTDLAKYQNSWDCLPHVVSRGAQTNFVHFAESITESWETDEVNFNEDYFRDSVALGILFSHVESLISKQSWYENGYRANIVTYSIALLSFLIKKTYPNKFLNLSLIWNKKAIPTELSDQMLIITKHVFEHITDPKREIINVTQWCKREKCWTNLKALDLELSYDIKNILIDKREKKEIQTDAKTNQKIVNEFEAQLFVVNLGIDYWENIYQWGKQKKLLTTDEKKLIETSLSLIRRSKLPNAIQSKKLQDVRSKLLIEGYVEVAIV
ncbi:AIPR family protein [Paenibacillus frigoriresistens]|uniref:AIPR family protein n=1 Tax=Paenibacillus alginolyticus TaxID=59839 RepID=UPI001563D33D|nr:AIPR family protein [Paenibacillus frigoriresistens]NRF96202.1 AIPR family protein [Paenibacillus frigoriresistens]